jgi:hypothetical protein
VVHAVFALVEVIVFGLASSAVLVPIFQSGDEGGAA